MAAFLSHYQGFNTVHFGLLAWLTGTFNINVNSIHQSSHTYSGSQWQQAKQRIPDVPLSIFRGKVSGLSPAS